MMALSVRRMEGQFGTQFYGELVEDCARPKLMLGTKKKGQKMKKRGFNKYFVIKTTQKPWKERI
jgi:hypothetical protein